jgi:CRP-like cAMP-binding protein
MQAHGHAMPDVAMKYVVWAFLLGAISAVSLPIGSLLGVYWKPRPALTAALTAFGAGALLAALSIELVAPTVMAAVGHGVTITEAGRDPQTELVYLLLGCVVGGILFVILDQLVNAHGGYLRKTATTITFLRANRAQRLQRMLQQLRSMELLHDLTEDELRQLVESIRPVLFTKGTVIFNEGDEGDNLYFIDRGAVQLQRQGEVITTLGPGDVLGEIALLTGVPRTARALACEHTITLALSCGAFDRLRCQVPALERATSHLASERLAALSARDEASTHSTVVWMTQASAALRHGRAVPTPHEVQQAAREHNGAPLAIWLGIFLDGIPESLVIGMVFLGVLTAQLAQGAPSFHQVVPYALIAGLFLSNFPEALSSSVGMRQQGWRRLNVLSLWLSLMLMTAFGAMIGYLIGPGMDPTLLIGIRGIAAGAMLTMIAQTMVPEAVHLGGPNMVGLSTLGGFLAAIAFKFFEA